jgi:hypothetical protein
MPKCCVNAWQTRMLFIRRNLYSHDPQYRDRYARSCRDCSHGPWTENQQAALEVLYLLQQEYP